MAATHGVAAAARLQGGRQRRARRAAVEQAAGTPPAVPPAPPRPPSRHRPPRTRRRRRRAAASRRRPEPDGREASPPPKPPGAHRRRVRRRRRPPAGRGAGDPPRPPGPADRRPPAPPKVWRRCGAWTQWPGCRRPDRRGRRRPSCGPARPRPTGSAGQPRHDAATATTKAAPRRRAATGATTGVRPEQDVGPPRPWPRRAAARTAGRASVSRRAHHMAAPMPTRAPIGRGQGDGVVGMDDALAEAEHGRGDEQPAAPEDQARPGPVGAGRPAR